MQHTPDHTCNHVVESDGRKCNYKRGGQVGKIRAAMLLFGRGRSNDYLKLFLTRAVYSKKKQNRPIRAFRANKCILFLSLFPRLSSVPVYWIKCGCTVLF